MAALHATVLLCLLSLTAAAPPGCEDAVLPLAMDDLSQIFGKWFLHAIRSNSKDFESLARGLRSFWMELSPIPENNTVLLKTVMGGNVSCQVFSAAVQNNTLFGFNIGHDMKLKLTCPTCLELLTIQKVGEKVVVLLYTYGRKQSLSHSHMDTFRRHGDCLGLNFSLYLDPEKDVCPEGKEASLSLPGCEVALSPLDLDDQILGKWFLIGGANNLSSIVQNYAPPLENTYSAWMKLSSTPLSSTVLFTFATQMHEVCQMFSDRGTRLHNTIVFDRTALELLSCPDCLLVRVSNSVVGRMVLSLQLWGRTRTLAKSATDTFKKQVDCLGLGVPQYMDPTKDLCPEPLMLLSEET